MKKEVWMSRSGNTHWWLSWALWTVCSNWKSYTVSVPGFAVQWSIFWPKIVTWCESFNLVLTSGINELTSSLNEFLEQCVSERKVRKAQPLIDGFLSTYFKCYNGSLPDSHSGSSSWVLRGAASQKEAQDWRRISVTNKTFNECFV